jgi:hypothetical protein
MADGNRPVPFGSACADHALPVPEICYACWCFTIIHRRDRLMFDTMAALGRYAQAAHPPVGHRRDAYVDLLMTRVREINVEADELLSQWRLTTLPQTPPMPVPDLPGQLPYGAPLPPLTMEGLFAPMAPLPPPQMPGLFTPMVTMPPPPPILSPVQLQPQEVQYPVLAPPQRPPLAPYGNIDQAINANDYGIPGFHSPPRSPHIQSPFDFGDMDFDPSGDTEPNTPERVEAALQAQIEQQAQIHEHGFDGPSAYGSSEPRQLDSEGDDHMSDFDAPMDEGDTEPVSPGADSEIRFDGPSAYGDSSPEPRWLASDDSLPSTQRGTPSPPSPPGPNNSPLAVLAGVGANFDGSNDDEDDIHFAERQAARARDAGKCCGVCGGWERGGETEDCGGVG